eukprot:scaffold248459_cov84-Cyclotella_meneghiniana.AAC.1
MMIDDGSQVVVVPGVSNRRVTIAVDRWVLVPSFLACDNRRGQAGVMLGRQLPVDRWVFASFLACDYRRRQAGVIYGSPNLQMAKQALPLVPLANYLYCTCKNLSGV